MNKLEYLEFLDNVEKLLISFPITYKEPLDLIREYRRMLNKED